MGKSLANIAGEQFDSDEGALPVMNTERNRRANR